MKSETSFRVFFLKQHRKNSLKNICFPSENVFSGFSFWPQGHRTTQNTHCAMILLPSRAILTVILEISLLLLDRVPIWLSAASGLGNQTNYCPSTEWSKFVFLCKDQPCIFWIIQSCISVQRSDQTDRTCLQTIRFLKQYAPSSSFFHETHLCI